MDSGFRNIDMNVDLIDQDTGESILQGENERLQGENKRLQRELQECREKLKTQEEAPLIASAPPPDALHDPLPSEVVQAVPVIDETVGMNTYEAPQAEVKATVVPMERAYRTKGWTIFHQVDTLSHLSNQNAAGPSPCAYALAKDHCIEAGYVGFVTSGLVNDGAKWYRDLSTDKILRELDHHGDSISRPCRVHLIPGIEMNKLVSKVNTHGRRFKIEFEMEEDGRAFIERGGSFNPDVTTLPDSFIPVTDKKTEKSKKKEKDMSKKKKRDSSKKGGFQVTEGWIQIIGASPVSPGHEDQKARNMSRDHPLRTDKMNYASKCAEMNEKGLIGWRERNDRQARRHGYGWWPIRHRDPTKMLEETYKDSRINTYISPGIDFRTLIDVSKERNFKLILENIADIEAARYFGLDFEERAEQGGTRKKRSKRKRSKRTKRKRSKRRRTKRKRTKRTKRRRSRRRF